MRSKKSPLSVKLNGVPFAPYTPGSDSRAASQWWWDTAEIHLRFRADKFHAEIGGIVTDGYDD